MNNRKGCFELNDIFIPIFGIRIKNLGADPAN
jgi:hypothetical protein